MRIILDIEFRRPNRKLREALDEILQRHTIGGILFHEGREADHETYDICMAAIGTVRRGKLWRGLHG